MSRVSQARNPGKYFLLIDNMLVVLGFFVVFPLISIRFVDQMGWAAVMVGIALGLRQFIQQGLGIFGGAIADRFGAKPMIVTGMLMRAAGFATMGIAHEPWLLWFSCLLSGLGGTLFDPPRSALVVKLIRPQQRGRFFSLLMMQDSAGAVIGALLKLAVAIRLSPGLRHRGRFVCTVCSVQCVVITGMETLHRTHARSRRHDPRDARQAFCHLCPDAGGLLHAGCSSDADAANYGQRRGGRALCR